MKSVDLKVGDRIQIGESPSSPLLQSVTLSISCNKALSEQCVDETSISILLRLFYENKSILLNSCILLPCQNSFLLADVVNCFPQQGIFSKETKIVIDKKDERRAGSRIENSEQMKNILSLLKYAMDMKLNNSPLLINGIIVYGEKGNGKSTVLHSIVNELNCYSPDSSVFVSSNDISQFKWKYY